MLPLIVPIYHRGMERIMPEHKGVPLVQSIIPLVSTHSYPPGADHDHA
jgi:hypothetical protein